MSSNAFDIPSDFTPVSELLPAWLDIEEICKDARRFVALHTLSNFNSVAINDGLRVFTTDDLGGEFRRRVRELTAMAHCEDPAEAALVYDCESHRQWLAPKPSAIQFLNLQF